MTEFTRLKAARPVYVAFTLVVLILMSLLLGACGDGAQPSTPNCNPLASVPGESGSTTPDPKVTVPAPPTVAVSAQAKQTLDTIGQQAAKIRCLQFKADVEKNFMTRDALAKYQLDLFNLDNPPEQIAQAEKTLEVFGFVPKNFDLQKTYTDLYSEQVLGFYDPRTKKFYIILDQQTNNLTPLAKFTAAHELTHALQDQHFDLQKLRPQREPNTPEGNDDEGYALTALIEGDAVVSQTLWVQAGNLSRQELAQMQSESSKFSQTKLNSSPLILRDTLNFPYQDGNSFVNGIFKKGGWDAVNKAFTDYPPRSTAQILHPEKYDSKVEPVKIELPSMVETLGSGWKSVDINTMGELQSRIWLNGIIPKEQATDAVSGWAGDRYQVLESPQGQYGYVWRSQWDSVAKAGGFLKGATILLTHQYNLQGDGGVGLGQKRIWSSQDIEVGLVQKGNQVLIVVLPKGNSVDKIMGKLGF